MLPFSYQTPVVLIIFNRPEKTRKALEAIKQVRPKELFIIADGPRQNKEEDESKCYQTRSLINSIDWKCKIHKNYSDQNLGCSKRISSGLNWVFENVESAIILEDDCIPDPTFFRFCEELLLRYKDDTRIFAICGQNIQGGREELFYDYYFSRYSHCWGWATWRRAWRYFDYEMNLWEEAKEKKLLFNVFGNRQHADSWTRSFDYVLKGKSIDSWAFRWTFACFMQNALNIIPSVNLVTNIGFDSEATHTTKKDDNNIIQKCEPFEFPINHPPFMIRNIVADDFTQRTEYNYHPGLLEKVFKKLKSYF